MKELDTKLRDSVPCNLKMDLDKLVEEMTPEQIAALPDGSILRAVYFAKNRLGPFY